MVVSVPQRGAAKPRRIAHFDCPTFVIFQVIGAFTVFICETAEGLTLTADGVGVTDGLNLTQANTSPPVGYWWNGDLWAAASVPSASFLMSIPGQAGNAQVPLTMTSQGPVITQ